ncbi:hypothetical protein B0H10DRAFT_1948521 [Mycena sp. CBHHK59/15]|nr:hypothetical protein B0H10DRAFT_1948521 [Mycena sp. CBHHK59/15]
MEVHGFHYLGGKMASGLWKRRSSGGQIEGPLRAQAARQRQGCMEMFGTSRKRYPGLRKSPSVWGLSSLSGMNKPNLSRYDSNPARKQEDAEFQMPDAHLTGQIC